VSSESQIEFFEGNLVFNGINGVTGDYLVPPMPSEKLARLVQGKGRPSDEAELLGGKPVDEMTEEEVRREEEAEKERLGELGHKEQVDYPVRAGVDPTRLDQAGWAVVFPAKMESQRKAAIEEALKPLFDLRREQAGDLFRIFEGGAGYRSGERKDQFCQHQEPEIRAIPAEPKEMPFYVLLVGSPEEIPYEFQFQLDVMRGVGRIDFGDDFDAYARYAQSVVLAETGQVKLPRRASFFGVANPGDKATQLSAQWLVRPLYDGFQSGEIALQYPWQVEAFVGQEATKSQLKRLLGGDQTPAFLFTASHGMAYPLDHPREQLAYQGALVCQDWAGPRSRITPDHFFAGEDLASEANITGLMAMFFACYGAGTPKMDAFAKQAFKARTPIAPEAFLGALPNRLLGQGALAVFGHVERAWGYSFVSPGGNLDNQTFIDALKRLLNGDPLGLATDQSFNLRYASKSSDLSHVLEELDYNPAYVTDYELAHMWTTSNDARNYVVLGDPAARLPVEDVSLEAAERPSVIEVAYRPTETPLGESEAEPYAAEPAEPTGIQAETPAELTLTATGPQTYSVSGTIALQPSGAGGALPGTLAPGVPGSYGFLWGKEEVAEVKDKIVSSVQGFVERMTQAVEKAMTEVTTLEVLTYTSEDLAQVKKEDPEGTATLRAVTRIEFDGDIKNFVPTKGGQIDQALWTLHLGGGDQDLLGLWTTVPVPRLEAVTFDTGDAPTEPAPVWRADYPADPGQAAGALEDARRGLAAAEMALDEVPARLDLYLVQERIGVSYALPAPGAQAGQAEDDLSLMLAEMRGTVPVVSFEAEGEFAGRWEEAFEFFQSFSERLKQLAAHYTWVETRVEGRLVGQTAVSWTGDVDTILVDSLDPELMRLHEQTVQLALASRQMLLRTSAMILANATKISALIATPGGIALAIPAVLRFINQVRKELKQKTNKEEAQNG
jgi:hypothetical protein